MSQSVHALHMRNGIKFGNADLKDTMISDGLTDSFTNIHMGITGKFGHSWTNEIKTLTHGVTQESPFKRPSILPWCAFLQQNIGN